VVVWLKIHWLLERWPCILVSDRCSPFIVILHPDYNEIMVFAKDTVYSILL